MTIKNIFCIAILLIGSLQLRATDTTSVQKQRSVELFEWGFSLGYGFVNEQLPEGKYEPFLLLAHVEFHAHRKQRNPDSPHYFLLFGEPQINPVFVNGGLNDWEAGCNIGIKYLIKMKEINGLYFHVGSGPQFISVWSPEHQANGFAFSNNFGLGYQRVFKRDVTITFGYRFRHVSNLDLHLPNLGLDNHFFTVGFKKDFPRRALERRHYKQLRLLEE